MTLLALLLLPSTFIIGMYAGFRLRDRDLAIYLRAGGKDDLPQGIAFTARRRHSESASMASHGDPS